MSGLDGWIAVSDPEDIYGTAKVPVEAVEYLTEGIDPDPNFLLSQQIRNGRKAPSADRRQRVSDQAAGPVNMEIPDKGFWRHLNLLRGGVVNPVAVVGSAGAFTRTYLEGRGQLDAKSATAVVGRPMTGGGVQPFTYLGGLITAWQLVANQTEFATWQETFDFREEDVEAAAPAITYPADLGGFVLEDSVLMIDGSEPAGVVRGVTLSGTRPMAVDRRGANSSGKKRKPISNGVWAGEASVETEFFDMSLVNKFREKNRISTLELTLKGTTPIVGVTVPQLKVTLGAVGWNGATPNVDGPDLLDMTVGLTVLDDDSIAAPVVFEVLSAEA